MVCLEDGIIATGFRKFTGLAERVVPNTGTYYVSSKGYLSAWKTLTRKFGEVPEYTDSEIDDIAESLKDADIIGLSSMTGYAGLTKRVASRIKQLSSQPFIIWGGIHPIIHPEDAIAADVDAICVGEGELAFEEFYDLYVGGRDHQGVRNFWFKDGDKVIRNGFRPLMTNDELDRLPFAKYGTEEQIHRRGAGFVPVTSADYRGNSGLSYPAIWSIGCPLHCTFCGNTVFIANDANYAKVRHPSPRYIVDEVKAVREQHPYISTVQFFDDSFMAIGLPELEEFAELWRAEVSLPFAVYGVIPTYVRQDKLEVLSWAGLNRLRMGIQSGSERMLKFYKRPTPLPKVEEAAQIIGGFAKWHISPSYDIIVDNPVETRQDVVDTLELLWRLARPYSLNIFSLKVIPNTVLEEQMTEAGLDIETISQNFHVLRPSWSNILLYLLILWRPPRWLFERLLRRVRACGEPQASHGVLLMLVRILWMFKQGVRHMRRADFSMMTGGLGYTAWKLGGLSLWLKLCTPNVDAAAAERGWRVPAESGRSLP